MSNKRKFDRIEIVNTDTGEILGTTLKKANLKDEDVIIKIVDSKQQEAVKKKTETVEQMECFIKENEGRFFHLVYKYSYPLMVELQDRCEGTNSNIHIIRFMILGTYLTFGNRLFDSNGNEIKKSSLSKIWHTDNRNGINETYELLKKCKYIEEDEGGNIMLNNDIVKKGAIEDFKKLKKEDEGLTYTRVYSETLQKIYEDTPPKQRKHLASLFMILPFVNYKYNVFCNNPEETDEKKLDLLTWKELASICGYDIKNYSRVKRDLMKIKIYGHEVIGQFETDSGKSIVINPKIYYAGNNIDEVQHLYAMFNMCANGKKKK